MSQPEMGKTSLPSIQFLLQEAPRPIIPNDNNIEPIVVLPTNPKRQFGHRASRSISSLPADLQSLSLHAPTAQTPSPSTSVSTSPSPSQPQVQVQAQAQEDGSINTQRTRPYGGTIFSSNEKTPSWMIPSNRPAMSNNNSNFITNNHHNINNSSNSSSSSSSSNISRRKPSFAGHGRSVSEFALPPLPSSISPSSLQQHHQHDQPHLNRQYSHRRAVSANTLDFMLSPHANSDIRAQSYSPQEQHLAVPHPQYNHSNNSFFDPLGSNIITGPSGASQQQMISTTAVSPSSGYFCTYCHKKFSRPSSLRIHTYSHTGEKPFVCSEPGCGRHFSVQSNMRRHLRVHRLGRSINNNASALETTNEE